VPSLFWRIVRFCCEAFRMRWWSPWSAKVAILFGALLAITAVLDLAGVEAVSHWARDHPVALAAAVEAVLLLGTYVVVERVVAERERERWKRAAQGSTSDLWFSTHIAQKTFADWERKTAPGDLPWWAFTTSVQNFRRRVDTTEPRMQTTPELAQLWFRFDKLCAGFHSFAQMPETTVRKVIDGPPGTLQAQLRGLQANANELLDESKPFADAAAGDEMRLAGLR
jgi:hypothetical protein